LKGDVIFESGPGLRNWITPESVEGLGMAVAPWVGGRLRVGRGSKVSVGIEAEVASGVGLASVGVALANSGIGELAVGVGSGSLVGMGVSGSRARVGICTDGTGIQAVKKRTSPSVRMKRRYIIRL